jgi:hypothetical protein
MATRGGPQYIFGELQSPQSLKTVLNFFFFFFFFLKNNPQFLCVPSPPSKKIKKKKVHSFVSREVLGRSKISGNHPEILLDNGIFVIICNYKNAIVKQNFRMISGNFASLKYYPLSP